MLLCQHTAWVEALRIEVPQLRQTCGVLLQAVGP